MTRAALLFLLAMPTASATATEPDRFPTFGGSVVPITAPIRPEYRSHDSTTTISTEMELRAGSAKPDRVTSRVHVAASATRRGDEVTTLARVLRVETSTGKLSKRERDALPRIVQTTVTDPLGREWHRTRHYEAANARDVSPLPPEGSKAHQDWLAEARAQSAMNVLPDSPVTSGSTMALVSFRDVLLSAAPDFADFLPDDKVEAIVAGWGFIDGRKVLIAEHRFHTTLDGGDEGTASLAFGGYIARDAASMAPVKGETLVLLSANSYVEARRFVLRMRVSLDAEIINRADEPAAPPVTPSVVAVSSESRRADDGTSRSFVFLDVDWQAVGERDAGRAGRLILSDASGTDRVAMPWSIPAGTGATRLESGVGFAADELGAAAAWLRTADLSEIRARFEPSP